MANILPEVSRIFDAKENGDENLLEQAMIRAKSILKELKDLANTRDNKEIDILADVIEDLGKIKSKYKINRVHLESYFYPFAEKYLRQNNLI